MWFKKKEVPESTATKMIDIPQLWEVRWRSRNGEYSGDTRPEMEAFLSLEEAESFKTALVNAFKLIKHTSGTRVTLDKAK